MGEAFITRRDGDGRFAETTVSFASTSTELEVSVGFKPQAITLFGTYASNVVRNIFVLSVFFAADGTANGALLVNKSVTGVVKVYKGEAGFPTVEQTGNGVSITLDTSISGHYFLNGDYTVWAYG